MAEIEFHSGPLGLSITKDGKPVGSIKKRVGGWMLKIDGHTFKLAEPNRITKKTDAPVMMFPSLNSAKETAIEILQA